MKWCLIIATCFFTVASAQPGKPGCAKEINETVWKPFVKHLVSGNNIGFRALHSKKISRVLIDDNILQDYDKYFPVDKRNDTPAANTGRSRMFELRFDKRICNGDKAWETGYYKSWVTGPGNENRTNYGRFFVLLEKEEGVWKIIVDADTGKEASAENFNKADPVE